MSDTHQSECRRSGKSVEDDRYEWLRATEETEAGVWGSLELSPQGNLLSYDIELAFCAGAWISVIVISHAAIDAIIRDTELKDYESNSKKIFAGDVDLEWLRKLRNRLVHVSNPDNHPEFVGAIESDVSGVQDSFEADAKRAVALLFRTMYANPGT